MAYSVSRNQRQEEQSTSITAASRGRRRMTWAVTVTVAILLLVAGSCLIVWSLTADSKNKNNNSNNNNSIPNDKNGLNGEQGQSSPTSSPTRRITGVDMDDDHDTPTTRTPAATTPGPAVVAGSATSSTMPPTLAPKRMNGGSDDGSTTNWPSNVPTLQPRTLLSSTKPVLEPTSQPASGPTTPSSSSSSSVVECLRSIAGLDVVVTPTDDNVSSIGAERYDAARTCLVYPPSTTTTIIQPIAIVQPQNVANAAAVVRCVAQFPPTTVSARSGAHSFTAQSCRGDIILDLQRLNSFEVTVVQDSSSSSSLVTWGAGQLHGQLYSKLLSHQLVLPGGAEVMVGTGGLWLGCGRGPLTQAYGLSCDQLRSIEYIDHTGTIVQANTNGVNNADTDSYADLFWMARGGGSLFPGIVTKFTAIASPMPTVVYRESCYLPNTAPLVKAAVRTYTAHLDIMNDPDRTMFGALIVERPHVKFEFHCFNCSSGSTKLQRIVQLKEDLLTDLEQEVGVEAVTAVAMCESTEYGYADYLLQSTMWDAYDTVDDLERRSQWPEWKDYWGRELKGSGYNGGILVPDKWSFTEELIDDIVTYTQTLPGNAADRTFLDYFSIYPLKGRGSDDVALTDTAFGGRNSQAIIHYKKDKVDDNAAQYKQHMDDFERTLVGKHGLPCRGFFNYFDEDLVCATNDDEWLTAFFSDPARIRSIVTTHDPNRVFFRLRL